jgi:hypothetical protein
VGLSRKLGEREKKGKENVRRNEKGKIEEKERRTRNQGRNQYQSFHASSAGEAWLPG